MLSTHTAYPGLNPYTSLYNPEGMEKGKDHKPNTLQKLLKPIKNHQKFLKTFNSFTITFIHIDLNV